MLSVWTEATGRLLEALQQGARFDFVAYPDNADVDARVAWNGMRHDQDSNRYLPTSVEVKLKIVQGMRARVPGGDWQSCMKDRGLFSVCRPRSKCFCP